MNVRPVPAQWGSAGRSVNLRQKYIPPVQVSGNCFLGGCLGLSFKKLGLLSPKPGSVPSYRPVRPISTENTGSRNAGSRASDIVVLRTAQSKAVRRPVIRQYLIVRM